MVKLPPLQLAVLAQLFQTAPIHEEAETLEFKLSNTEDTFYSAVIRLRFEAGYGDSYLVASLASVADRVYMAVTASRPHEVARALANLEDYDREGILEGGNTIQIPDAGFAARGLSAAILLRPATLNGFDEVVDSCDVKGQQLTFSLVLFLTKEELEFKRSRGHDALMDRFDSEGRSVVVFGTEQ